MARYGATLMPSSCLSQDSFKSMRDGYKARSARVLGRSSRTCLRNSLPNFMKADVHCCAGARGCPSELVSGVKRWRRGKLSPYRRQKKGVLTCSLTSDLPGTIASRGEGEEV